MQAIEELNKALAHLRKARELDPLFQPYQDNPYSCLLLGRAIRYIKDIPGMLKGEKARHKKEDSCKP